MRAPRALIAVGVAIGLAACGLVSGIDDLRTGDLPDGSASGGSSGVDGASGESSGGDGSGGEAAARFCASAPPGSFCDDFDGENALAPWTISPLGVALDRQTVRSPPAALGVTAPTAKGFTYASRALPAQLTNEGVRLAVSVLLDPGVSMTPIRVTGATNGFVLTVSPSASTVAFDGGSVIASSSMGLLGGAWRRVEMTIVPGANQLTVTVTYDGTQALSGAIRGSTAPPYMLDLGDVRGDAPGHPTRFDDVIVTAP